MNYLEWAEEYLNEAGKVLGVIEKKKLKLKEEGLTSDDKKALSDTIISYRCIYRELLATANRLKERAGDLTHAA